MVVVRKAAASCVCALLMLQMAPIAIAQQPAASQFVSHWDKDAGEASKRERFVAKLLSEMTLEEKLGQVSQLSYKDTPHDVLDIRLRKGLGSVLFIKDTDAMNRIQKIAVTETRLHIPLLFGFDVVHGYRTISPVPIALAASWDPATMEHAEAMAGKEARANGQHWAFGPMVDIARDARWGRMMEGAGEDPYLGSVMAAAAVRGLQGEYVGSPEHILASVKHFAAYGAVLGGRDYEESDVSEYTLRNVYFPPHHAAEEAGAATFMSAYQDLNGIPASANHWLLRDVLHDEWGFKGFVVSDWCTPANLIVQGFAKDGLHAATAAMNAGVDMEMTSTEFYDHLGEAVKSGMVSEKRLDEAVRPILDMKYRLGLFDDPYVHDDIKAAVTGSVEIHDASRIAAERSAVLLKNDGTLPLKKSVHTLAVIGPMADSKPDTLGSWSLGANVDSTITVLDGLKRKLPGVTILSTKGVEISRPGGSIFDDQFASPKPTLMTDKDRDAEFQRAISLVKKADATVLVLGESQDMNGEHASRGTLTLPGKQQQLLEAAVGTGKPVVLLLMTARPLDLNWASQHVNAILNAWYPGSDGGLAVANLLLGDAVPAGKLPVSWPREAGQEPLYYNHNLTQFPDDAAKRYWDISSAPLYPFGYGLSYAKFALSNLRLEKESINANSPLRVSLDVKNDSAVAADEVVQLYTHQRAGTASRPIRELKAFERVSLQPGETKTVTLSVTVKDLAFWSPIAKRWQAEPGTFDVWVGEDSNASLHATFTLEGKDAIAEGK